MLMNRPVRSRTRGGVGRVGEKLALTRFRCFFMLKHNVTLLLIYTALALE
jgi:hypothetical protein